MLEHCRRRHKTSEVSSKTPAALHAQESDGEGLTASESSEAVSPGNSIDEQFQDIGFLPSGTNGGAPDEAFQILRKDIRKLQRELNRKYREIYRVMKVIFILEKKQ